MKHLKLFEDLHNDIKKGDYVLLDTTNMHLMNSTSIEKEKFNYFLSNNIGIVYSVDIDHLWSYKNITIKYNNISLYIKHFFNSDGTISIPFRYVKYLDSNLENIKIKIEGEPYNL